MSTHRGGYHKFLVRWLGKPSSKDSWMNADELTKLSPILLECYCQGHSVELNLLKRMRIGAITRLKFGLKPCEDNEQQDSTIKLSHGLHKISKS